MIIEPLLTEQIVKIRPEWQAFRDKTGALNVKLMKAMYGCLESAILVSIGFQVNPVKAYESYVCVYVDDLMITCADRAIIDEVLAERGRKFPGIAP